MANKNNIYVFFGTDAKVGVTMLTSCISESLANQNIDVCYMHLDGKYGDEYIKDEEHICSNYGLDDLHIKLQSKILTTDDIKRSCSISLNHLYHLHGNKDMLKKYDYTPDEVSDLIEECQKNFDVVIVDAGSDIHLGMTVSALLSTENRFLITTQQYLSQYRFNKLIDILTNLEIDFKNIIVNKYILHDELSNYKDAFVKLPYLEFGWQCEKDGISLMKFSNNNYIKGIEVIAKYIMSTLYFRWNADKSMVKSKYKFANYIWNFIKNKKRGLNYESGIQSQ